VSGIDIIPPEEFTKEESDRLNQRIDALKIKPFAEARAKAYRDAGVEDDPSILGRIWGEVQGFKEAYVQADLNIDIGRLGYLESEGKATGTWSQKVRLPKRILFN